MPATQKRLSGSIDTKSLIDLSPIVHYLARPSASYVLTFVSAAAEANTGYKPETFTESADFWIERIHPDDRDRVAAARADVIEKGAHRHEYRFRHACGEWRWVHDEATLIRDEAGAPLAVSGVWLDITTRRLAEALLQQQKAFSDSLIENAPTIVLILDQQGRIAKVNPYFEEKTGYSADEVEGRDWFDTLLPAADRVEIRGLFDSVMRQGVIAGHVNPIVAKDGRLLQIEWFAQVLTDAAGRFAGLLNVGHDVTERIEYEGALERSKREAERANAAKSRFLVTASHDLRQPLQALLLLNSSLRRLVADPKLDGVLEMQSQALKGMSGLLNALLDIGKLESGAIQPKIVDVPIREVFQQVHAEFDVQARAKGLEFVVDRCACAASADRELLTQLVQNVVANAIRYTREGGVRLRCRCETGEVTILVEDSGIGIPEDQREAIFDEFYQVDHATSNGGLGLGLSIVKRIAALLGARIDVESEVGRGSTFCFTVRRGDQAAAEPRPPGGVARGEKGGTVLLIDDDPAVLAASQLFLEIEGYDVLAASTPAEVDRSIVGEPPIDLIVTDYHLNDPRTGLDVVSAVRERLGRTVPAILVTGDTSPSVGEAQVERLEMMNKPIDTNQLLSLAQSMIGAAPR